MKKKVFRATSRTNPNQLAGAIAIAMREVDCVEIQAVGAGAVNQSVKGIAVARGFLIPTGVDIKCAPAFKEIEIDGDIRTAIILKIKAE